MPCMTLRDVFLLRRVDVEEIRLEIIFAGKWSDRSILTFKPYHSDVQQNLPDASLFVCSGSNESTRHR